MGARPLELAGKSLGADSFSESEEYCPRCGGIRNRDDLSYCLECGCPFPSKRPEDEEFGSSSKLADDDEWCPQCEGPRWEHDDRCFDCGFIFTTPAPGKAELLHEGIVRSPLGSEQPAQIHTLFDTDRDPRLKCRACAAVLDIGDRFCGDCDVEVPEPHQWFISCPGCDSAIIVGEESCCWCFSVFPDNYWMSVEVKIDTLNEIES